MRPSGYLLASCTVFAVAWTLVLGYFLLFAGMSAGPASGGYPTGVLWMLGWLSLPMAAIGWVSAGVTALWWRNERRVWRQSGFSEDVYNLMVRMRGAGSRLALLQHLDAPRHRMELSQLSGLDWKEVDRETSLLERYGLVSLYAESGSVKLYKMTEQGRMLLKLMEELNRKG